MSTPNHQTDTKLLDRRQLLKLAAASVLLLSACTEVKDEPASDRAISELRSLLDEMTSNDQQQTLIGIAERIEAQARDIIAEHQAFVDDFNQMLNDRYVTETQLGQLINAYAKQRVSLRNNLLLLQDELHTSLSPEQWAEVVQVLNQTGKAVTGYTL
ncbi:MAG: hypothetical protein HKP12_13835 [Gammaproteobacteria bacterium]|nr:hypothetical protein [Gammaproteobacteria bacterium]NNJ98229.1 hypothetical protein [Gammaproteobacteria bacterium]